MATVVSTGWLGDFWSNLTKDLQELDDLQIEYGYYAEDIHKNSGLEMGTLATIMEYGSDQRNIPARPFVLYSAYILLDEPSSIFTTPFVNFLYKGKGKDTFNSLARRGVRSIQKSIMTQDFEELKPETIAKKGFSTILVENHELINGIRYKISKKEET